MIQHVCVNFSGMYASLQQYMSILEMQVNFILASARQTNNPIQAIPSSDIPASTKAAIATFVAGFAVQECKHLGLHISEQKAGRLQRELKANQRFTPESMMAELRGLKETIVMELATRKFAYIPSPNDQYFEQEKLFGDEVYEKFPEARRDIKDAGNCLAVSLTTASVFHLMRAAEHGLRKLAKRLNVKLTHTGKPMPIEFGDWDKVITGIRNKIADARKLPAGPKRQAKLETYSSAADHCEYMKDIWRNSMAHTRKPYNEPEAIGVLERVRDFFRFLGSA